MVERLALPLLLLACDSGASDRPVKLGWDDPTPFGYTSAEAVAAIQAAVEPGLAFSWASNGTCWDERTPPESVAVRITPERTDLPFLLQTYARSGPKPVVAHLLELSVVVELQARGEVQTGEYHRLSFEPNGRDFSLQASLGASTLSLFGRLDDGTATLDAAALFQPTYDQESSCLKGACPTVAVSPPDTDPVCDGCCNRYAWQ